MSANLSFITSCFTFDSCFFSCCTGCCITSMHDQCDLAIKLYKEEMATYRGGFNFMSDKEKYVYKLLDQAIQQAKPDEAYELIVKFTENANSGKAYGVNTLLLLTHKKEEPMRKYLLAELEKLGKGGCLAAQAEFERRTKAYEGDKKREETAAADKKQQEENAENKRREEREREARLFAERPDLALAKQMHDAEIKALKKSKEDAEAARRDAETQRMLKLGDELNATNRYIAKLNQQYS